MKNEQTITRAQADAKTRYINRWKRQNRRKTKMGGRLMLAYNVPGTREAGQLAMLHAQPPESYLGAKNA